MVHKEFRSLGQKVVWKWEQNVQLLKMANGGKNDSLRQASDRVYCNVGLRSFQG